MSSNPGRPLGGLAPRQRWAIFALVGLAIVILVGIDYQWDKLSGRASLQIAVTYGLTLLILSALGVGYGLTRSRYTQTVRQLDMHRVLRQGLAEARDWDELVSIVLQFPRTIMPLVGDCLLVYDPKTSLFELVGEWSQDGKPLSRPVPSPADSTCSLYSHSQLPHHTVVPCSCFNAWPGQQNFRPFCLPLVRRDLRIGLLYLCLPWEASLTRNQAGQMNEVTLDMALAIERAQLEHSMINQAAARLAEKDHLSRYLHDTLGHDLAYLRLKLEQLSGDPALQGKEPLRVELKRMHDIANQSYEHVRHSLSSLREETPPDLMDAIHETATAFGDRAGFQVRLTNNGKMRFLSPDLRRQILYIVREILRNIEKHAQARNVTIEFEWNKEDLKLVIADDGQGFDLEVAEEKKGHYGLKIIKECAVELRGRLEIESSKNGGTRMTLRLPLDQPS